MRRSLVHPLLLLLLSSFAGTLRAQNSAAPSCSDSLGKTVAFLQGDWEGRSYSIAGRDTSFEAVMKVRSRPLFGPCTVEEHWTATKNDRVLFTARVLRAYDAGARRWFVYYVDDQLNSQVYEGRWEAPHWRFFRTRMDNGVPVQVRLTWRPTTGGYEQRIERSRDDGANWTLGGLVAFRSVPGSRRTDPH
jgi:hypothetical protein